MKVFVDWFRIIVVGAVFGLATISDFAWVSWALLGMTLTMIAIKIEGSK